MPKHIIICTPYRASDTTRAAIRLAGLLSAMGHSVRLANTTSLGAQVVDRGWDHKLATFAHLLTVRKEVLLIWMVPPSEIELAFMVMQRVPFAIVHNANFASKVHLPAYVKAKFIVCVDAGSYDWLCSIPELTDKVRLLPWDIGVPPTTRTSTQPSTVLLPLHVCSHKLVHPMYARLIVAAAESAKDVYVTVTTPKTCPRKLRRELKMLKRQTSKLAVYTPTDEIQEQMLYAHSSLVVWPADIDAFGTVTQAASYAGTPVLTWKDSPHTDIITHEKNGYLVDYQGVSSVLAHRRMWDSLNQLLLHPPRLNAMRRDTHARLLNRRRNFEKAWQTLMEGFL